MTAPVGPPAITIADVKAYLSLTDTSDDVALNVVVGAVNNLMADWFGPAVVVADEWPDRLVQGAVMLAARIYRRRNSPSGVESFGELGPIYVQRNDPDIAQMLGLGSYARPAVG